MATNQEHVPQPHERERDPVIEAYKPGIDRTLISANLRLTVQQRLDNLQAAVDDLVEFRDAMRQAKR
jgi:hypothetical protein